MKNLTVNNVTETMEDNPTKKDKTTKAMDKDTATKAQHNAERIVEEYLSKTSEDSHNKTELEKDNEGKREEMQDKGRVEDEKDMKEE